MADINSLLGNPAFAAGMSMLGASRDRRRDPFQAALQGMQGAGMYQMQRQRLAQQQQEQQVLQQQREQQAQQVQQFVQSPEFASLDPLSQQYIQATGDLSVVKSRLGAGPEAPSNVREWEYYSQLDPDRQRQYLEMKRAAQLMDLGDRFAVRDPVAGESVDIPGARVELAPSETPEHRGAVREAEAAASAEVDIAKQSDESARANNTAMSVYETAMEGLMAGLTGTDTGPVVGRLPALSADQQIAEGAVSAMAPVLKSIFRVAGEGTFTDKDQELLLNMLPTRKDRPEAIQEKMRNVDSIIRAKLGGSGAPVSVGAPSAPVRRRYNPQTGEFE